MNDNNGINFLMYNNYIYIYIKVKIYNPSIHKNLY